ncbi:hypothetical protein [Streptomyces sp. NPDC048225]|uniref:hypothetical protein n=1 Tax=Streptomyces sp. NPDC048225 TaxID=3365518 RepID=UPI00372044B3
MTYSDGTLIDHSKSPLAAYDQEVVSLAQALAAHPLVADAVAFGEGYEDCDITLTTAAHGSWTLSLQTGNDGEVFHPTTEPIHVPTAVTGAPAASVLRDIVAPALLAQPAYRAVAPTAVADGATLTVYQSSGWHYSLALAPA